MDPTDAQWEFIAPCCRSIGGGKKVIRSAVRLYDWMVRMHLEGKEIHLKSRDSRSTTPVTLSLPGLSHEK